jgi:hypothetical protein
VKHEEAGFVACANAGPNTNSSQVRRAGVWCGVWVWVWVCIIFLTCTPPV